MLETQVKWFIHLNSNIEIHKYEQFRSCKSYVFYLNSNIEIHK